MRELTAYSPGAYLTAPERVLTPGIGKIVNFSPMEENEASTV